ncbi:MAG TPA: hypothetical protein VGM76_15950 [Lacipirellulaceae bacterium]|jgi:hypothetical protein
MSSNLSIQLSDQTFSVLSSEALAAGKSPAELAAAAVESIYAGGPRVTSADAQAARARFEKCFGSVDLGRPIGIVNETIDSDLAQQYSSTLGST